MCVCQLSAEPAQDVVKRIISNGGRALAFPVSIFIYVYVYTYIYIYMHTYVNIYVYVYKCIHI